MNWIRQNWKMSETDLDTFEFESRRSQIVRLEYDQSGKRVTSSDDIKSEQEWSDWLQKDEKSGKPFDHSTLILLGSRMPDDEDFRNLMNLRYLPFTRQNFQGILDYFNVHESIARVINRNYAASFSRAFLPFRITDKGAIVYTCRSTAYWADDMALSITHFPDTGSTYGIFYGCSENESDRTAMRKICHRLTVESEDCFTHPMLLMGIFAEIERQRMKALVKSERESLMDSIESLKQIGYSAVGDSESPVSPWLTNYEIKNALEHWVSILKKIMDHIEELEQRYYSSTLDQSRSGDLTDQDVRKEKLQHAGRRIKDRLEEILLDYQEMIRDYEMIINGLTLATNLVLAQDNLQISTATINISNIAVNDGKQMKSIALLTMIFLPATFVATLFSMSLFDLDSSYMWLYPVIAIPLTLAVVAIYICVVLLPGRRKNKTPSLHSSLGGSEQSSFAGKTRN